MLEQEATTRSFKSRFISAVKSALKPALKTGWWMVRLTVCISLAVTLLQYFGIVGWLSKELSPVFRLIGLPGEAALVFITGYFVNLYSAIAVIETLSIDYRSVTILAVMCLCAHNMILETAVQKKTGSSAFRMVIVRTGSAFILAYILNLLLPENGRIFANDNIVFEKPTLLLMLKGWAISAGLLIAKMMTLILSLSILQRILGEFGIIRLLSKALRPIMKFFGLPAKTAFLWIVANILGLAYGSAVMIEERELGKISREDADLLNHHISISHSNLEDVLLFATVGALVGWMLISRWIISFVVVWTRKIELYVKAGLQATPTT